MFPETPQSKGRVVVSPLSPADRRNKSSSVPPLKVTGRLGEHLEDLRSREGSLTLRTTCISSCSLWSEASDADNKQMR